MIIDIIEWLRKNAEGQQTGGDDEYNLFDLRVRPEQLRELQRDALEEGARECEFNQECHEKEYAASKHASNLLISSAFRRAALDVRALKPKAGGA